MTSYVIETLRCSSCDGLFVDAVTASHNTFGAKFYTDGKVDGPMFDPGFLLIHCPHCGVVRWRDELTSLGFQSDSSFHGADNAEPSIWSMPVGESEIRSALGTSIARNSNDEIYLRTHIWWADNDQIRDDPTDVRITGPETRQNLERLRALLESNLDGSILMQAEIAREVGAFGDCISLIDSIPDSQRSPMSRLIAELAARRISVVASLPTGTQV